MPPRPGRVLESVQMPKKPTMPRIADASPAAFAARVVQLAAARTGLESPDDPLSVRLGQDAEAVAAFAVGAAPDGRAAERLERVSMAVYGSARPPSDLHSSVCVVLLAAAARSKVASGSELTTSEVAAASGLDAASVRRLSRSGALSRGAAGITAASASSLIESRRRADDAGRADDAMPA